MNINKINSNIQFLRGISVIIVFFFHYNQELFNTFFVGVDIFFLVSGYVITNSIFNKKRFLIFNYFLRRIKRIYPNLIFVLIFFIIIYYFLYKNYSDDYITNFFSIIFTFFGVSNLYYSLDPNLFYFNKEIRWLIHTWSLSIELQFYFLFGLIAFILFKLKKNDILKPNFKKSLLVSLFLISFFLFVFTDIKFISDYYSLPGRIWEFILGSILYFFHQKKKINFDRIFILFIFILSLLNIFHLDYKFIVIVTLLSIFLILLYSKEHKVNPITKTLVYYGKISYSFYLWHLIFISLLKDYFQLAILNFILIFIITNLFSHFSYNLIELKFNKKSHLDTYFEKIIKYSIFATVSLTIYISILNSSFHNKAYNELNKVSINLFHFIEKNRYNYSANKPNKYSWLSFDFCKKDYENFSWSSKVNCIKEDKNDTIIYLFGNSYGEHLIPVLSDVPNINFVISRFDNVYLNNKEYSDSTFKHLISQYNEITQRFKKKIILISLNETNYSIKKIRKFIYEINDKNTKIILLYPHPSFQEFKDNKLLIKYNTEKENNLLKLNQQNDIEIFDTFSFLCKKCNKKDYSKLFIDGAHFNLDGSLKLLEPLKKKLNLN